MLKGTEIATIIEAMGTSLDNCINPKRMPRHRNDPRPNRKPRFMLAPFEADPASKTVSTRSDLGQVKTGF